MEKYICYNENYGVSYSFDTKEACEEFINGEYGDGTVGEFLIYSYDSEMFPDDDPEIDDCNYVGFVDNLTSREDDKSESCDKKTIYILSVTDYINKVNEVHPFHTLDDARKEMEADYYPTAFSCDESKSRCIKETSFCLVQNKSENIHVEWTIAEFEV